MSSVARTCVAVTTVDVPESCDQRAAALRWRAAVVAMLQSSYDEDSCKRCDCTNSTGYLICARRPATQYSDPLSREQASYNHCKRVHTLQSRAERDFLFDVDPLYRQYAHVAFDNTFIYKGNTSALGFKFVIIVEDSLVLTHITLRWFDISRKLLRFRAKLS
jgi:hypothetical protein